MSKATSRKAPRSRKKPGGERPLPALLLACDPAKSAGFALFQMGHLVAYGPADGSSWKAMMQSAQPLVAPFQNTPGSRLMVIEQHWVSHFSQKGSMTLGQRRGIAQSVGEALGFDAWHYVPSATWQASIFNHKRPADTKAASMAFVKATYEFEPLTDDIADAICLGRYFLREGYLLV